MCTHGFKVKGEVYEVDAYGLSCLDALEGHPDWYNRQRIMVHHMGDPHTPSWIRTYAYYMPHKLYCQLYRKGRAKPISWFTCNNQPEPM